MLEMTAPEMETYRLHRRFDRMGRLIGDEKMKRLMESHVMVLGLGGVGSWAAESLVRSGVGRVTLVDFDDICITNFNRQLHSLQGLVGQKKVTVMAERLRKINPSAVIRPIEMFYNEDHHAQIFSENLSEGSLGRPDFVVDAIDHVTSKCFLLAHCVRDGLPVVTSTGSAGRLDPTQIQVTDLSQTEHDPLARNLRRILREKYAFPVEGAGKFGIHAVYSKEKVIPPVDLHYDQGKGFRCVCSTKDNEFFNCDNRNLIMGSASFVTGAYGLAAASVCVRSLTML